MGDLGRLRAAARAILDAAIAAGDARRLTREALAPSRGPLTVGNRAIDLARVRRVLVVGAGKASGAMAEAAEEVLGDRVAGGLVAVKAAQGARTRRVRVVEAGHPLPDARGEAAAAEILGIAAAAGADDPVLCLVSGGGSALLPLPVPGLALEEIGRAHV